jgi:predicted Zn-ribbon and HTH transcriptional regulator
MKESLRLFTTRIPEILEGWKNLVLTDSRIEKIALERLKVCSDCDQNNTNPELSMVSRCKACGCVLEAKARSPKSECPKNKWQYLEKI